MRKKYLFLTAVLLIVIFLVIGCGDDVVAIVNEEKITKSELDRRVEQYVVMRGHDPDSEEGEVYLVLYRDEVLEQLIVEKLYFQEARRRNLTADKESAKRELDKYKAQFASEEDYEKTLAERRMTEKEVLTIFQNEQIFNQLFEEVTKDITDTSRDLQQYYEENKAEFYQDTRIRARNIVVNTEEEALAIIERLDNGEDFGQLAVELSIDPTAKENKGDVGYFDQGSPLVGEFKEAAFKLKVGEYTKKPVQTVYGYHVIFVEDIIEGFQRTFEEVEQELRNRFIMEEKNIKFMALEEELLEKAKIEKHNMNKTEETNPTKGED